MKVRKSTIPHRRASSMSVLDAAEILDPERHRRMIEQAPCICFTGRQAPARAFSLGDVVDRHQHARPVGLVSRQDAAFELDVEPPSRQRVIGRMAGKLRAAFPELHQLLEQAHQHVVAENALEVGDQTNEIVRFIERQRLGVDLDDANERGARLYAPEILLEIVAQRDDAFRPPGVELDLEAAIILKPERHRRQIERLHAVCRRRRFDGGVRQRAHGCLVGGGLRSAP